MDVNVLVRKVEIFKAIDPEMQVATMLTFLYVARRGVCTQKDIEEELGLSNAAASRNVSYWSDFKIRDKPGMGYILREDDPKDRRYKRLTLTDAGRKFFETVTSKRF